VNPSLSGSIGAIAKKSRFSGVVHVARDGEFLLEQAWGLADRAHGIANIADTQFGIASGCKGFTAWPSCHSCPTTCSLSAHRCKASWVTSWSSSIRRYRRASTHLYLGHRRLSRRVNRGSAAIGYVDGRNRVADESLPPSDTWSGDGGASSTVRDISARGRTASGIQASEVDEWALSTFWKSLYAGKSCRSPLLRR
jgi:hypothetical protein